MAGLVTGPAARRPLGWWLAAAAVALCLVATLLRPVAHFGPSPPYWVRVLLWRLAHAAPGGFEIALVALLSIEPRRAAPPDAPDADEPVTPQGE